MITVNKNHCKIVTAHFHNNLSFIKQKLMWILLIVWHVCCHVTVTSCGKFRLQRSLQFPKMLAWSTKDIHVILVKVQLTGKFTNRITSPKLGICLPSLFLPFFPWFLHSFILFLLCFPFSSWQHGFDSCRTTCCGALHPGPHSLIMFTSAAQRSWRWKNGSRARP